MLRQGWTLYKAYPVSFVMSIYIFKMLMTNRYEAFYAAKSHIHVDPL